MKSVVRSCISRLGRLLVLLVSQKCIGEFVALRIFQDTEKTDHVCLAVRAAKAKPLPVRSLEVDVTSAPIDDFGFARRHRLDLRSGLIDGLGHCPELLSVLLRNR